MKKALAIMMIVALAMTAVFAQGSKEEAKSDIKVALIVSSTIDDKGWCQAIKFFFLPLQFYRGVSGRNGGFYRSADPKKEGKRHLSQRRA